MNDILCKCGEPMTMASLEAQRIRAFMCARDGEPGYDMCTPPIEEHYAAAHRLGPFGGPRPQPSRSAPFDLPGYTWTGEFFERVGSGPPRVEPAQSGRVDGVPWLRIFLWFGVALLLLRLL